jgi:hypothetical protein
MDNQNQQPIQRTTTTSPPKTASPNPVQNPRIKMTDEQAQALLAINLLQNGQSLPTKKSFPMMLIVSLITVVALAIIASVLVGNLKGKTTSNTSSSSSTPSSTNSTENNDGTTKQINQDVKSCSNPLTAISQC